MATTSKGARLVRAFCGSGWAIEPEKFAAIIAVIETHASQVQISDETPQWMVDDRDRPAPYRCAITDGRRSATGGIAVLPLQGVLSQRMNMMTRFSGGTSTDMFSGWLGDAARDPNVSQIVIDVDSPGGEVFGVQELADNIRAVAKRKPVTAVANSLAASGAYWIASAASRVYVTPGGQVGSIGVFMAHQDISAANEKAGIRTTYISAGRFKTEGNPDEPLSDEARAFYQSRVQDYYNEFTRAVARGRGVTVDAVRNGFGEGRVVGAKQALAEKMVDGTATLPDVIRQISRDVQQRRQQARADDAILMSLKFPAARKAAALKEDRV